jgi:hypothetical protein
VNAPSQAPQRKWPRFLLAGVIIFFIANAFWIYREVQRVKWMKSQRDTNAVFIVLPSASRPAATNAPSTSGK